MYDKPLSFVNTVSRIDKITGLFCRILSLLQGSFAKETYNFIDPMYDKPLSFVSYEYGVALVSRIDKIISLFCKRALQKRRYSAEETCDFIDPTDRSHPIIHMCESAFF